MKLNEINFTEIATTDSRALTPEALYERRLQYVRFRTAGMSNNQASALAGFRVAAGSNTWKKYQANGLEGLKAKRRGLPMGYNRALSPAQEIEIQDIISHHTPDELGLPYSLWSRNATRRFIVEKYGVELSPRTMSLYFSRWRFTYQRPAKQAYRQNPEDVKRFLEEEYSENKRRSHARKS